MHRINQMEPWLGEEERNAASAYMASGAWLIEFEQTAIFERAVAGYVGSAHAVATANGTLALAAALMTIDIGPGDEVLVPDYTMIATANAVVMCGATPVFVDVTPDNLCIDLEQAERAITPRTRAMILVSLNGRAPDMHDAVDLATRRGIHLVEDAAQSLGSFSAGRHLGSFGILGILSFSAPKIITTGQGGMVLTDDDGLAVKLRMTKDFGRRTAGIDAHERIGYNFKFTDLQAVIGIEQMKKLAWRVRRKRQMFARYRDGLAGVPEVTLLPTDLSQTSPWFIDVLVPDRGALTARLAEEGIGSRAFYPAIHSQGAYARAGSFPVSEHAARQGLWLPSATLLTDADIDRVIGVVRAHYGRT